MKTLYNILSLIPLIIFLYFVGQCKYAIGFMMGIVTVPIYNLVKMFVILVKDSRDQTNRNNAFIKQKEKRSQCEHDWQKEKRTPPWSDDIYCTKCGLNEDGYGNQW